MGEVIWKPIILDGMNTHYEISEYGTVRNTDSGNVLKPVPLKESGRLRVLIYNNGKRKDMKIHRLVYEAFYGPIPKDMTVDHIDENKFNNHYTNLRLLTASENIRIFREHHHEHCAKYSDDQIKNYYRNLKKGMYYKDAAKLVGIDSTEYALGLMNGRRRRCLWELYKPFPKSAHCKSYINESDMNAIIGLMMAGFSTKNIVQQLDLSYSPKVLDKLYKIRRKLGLKDPKYFDNGFITDIDKLIIDGKTNKEIYDILHIDFNKRISWLMSRRRNILGIPNENLTKGNREELNLIREYIHAGLSNPEILDKIGKERNQYYVDLFGRERMLFKKRNNTSTTIEKAPDGVTE